MMKDIAQSRREKKQLFVDAIKKERKPARIPLLDMTFMWRVLQSEFSLREALYDYDIMYKIICNFHEKYEFDTYFDLGLINPMRVYDALGKSSYVINDEKGFVNYLDRNNMEVEDYDVLINEGYMKYFWENFFIKKFEFQSKEDAYSKIYNTAKQFFEYQKFGQCITKQFNDVYGVPNCAFGRYDLPPEVIYWGMRGMKGMALDMRKRPELLEKGLEALKPYVNANFAETVKIQQTNDSNVFDFKLTMLCHNMMNNKQFERFYLPYFKEYARVMAENDKIGLIFIQGTADRIYEHLQDLPKGHFAVMLEQTDIFEAKKKIGDRVALVGGLPLQLLNYGTKQECVDHAKRLINEVGYDGSLIIAPEKMVSFANDANPENLLAINEFVKGYGIH